MKIYLFCSLKTSTNFAMNNKQVVYSSFDLIKSYWPFFRSLRHKLKKAHFLTKNVQLRYSFHWNSIQNSTLFPSIHPSLKIFLLIISISCFFSFQFTKLNVKSFLFIDHENFFRPIFILQVMNFKYSDDFLTP